VDRNFFMRECSGHERGRPSRRGVDRNIAIGCVCAIGQVAPHAGAWIETARLLPRTMPGGSPLTQGRGSKPEKPRCSKSDRQVAPHAGAWIETRQFKRVSMQQLSPLTQGRGSKRCGRCESPERHASPLTQGRGSKRYRGAILLRAARVAPHAGAWIETLQSCCWRRRRWSPLTQGRGSKRRRHSECAECRRVAPHAGAWIETRRKPSSCTPSASPLTQGRGSKHVRDREIPARRGRPSRRGVDRNAIWPKSIRAELVAPHAGAWIETRSLG